jgi:hypothetical protein
MATRIIPPQTKNPAFRRGFEVPVSVSRYRTVSEPDAPEAAPGTVNQQ